MEDALKLANSTENIGIYRDDKTLAVERRAPIQRRDTIFYNLAQLKVQQYEFEFIPNGLGQQGLVAFLQDNFTHTSTAIDLRDTARIIFNVLNVPGSYAPDRFMLVFERRGPVLPMIATADVQKNNEVNAANPYSDKGKIYPSAVPVIIVYPNPVTDKNIQLRFIDQPDGDYNIQLISKSGQVAFNNEIQLRGNNSDIIKNIKIPAVAAGSYQLLIISADGSKTNMQVIIL
jgi:hypothetical protein